MHLKVFKTRAVQKLKPSCCRWGMKRRGKSHFLPQIKTFFQLHLVAAVYFFPWFPEIRNLESHSGKSLVFVVVVVVAFPFDGGRKISLLVKRHLGFFMQLHLGPPGVKTS